MNIVVFTGSGVSRESGLQTFRDVKDGLWYGYDFNEVASITGWRANPEKVLDFYNMRRRDANKAEPNDAHFAIAELEADHAVTVLTQNVDDLHERAGSSRVVHLHGELNKVRPDGGSWEETLTWRGDLNLGDVHPQTGVQLRPHIVWFGEGLPELESAMQIALSPSVDLMIVIGTSLNVYPAAYLATETRARQVVVIDPDPPELASPRVQYLAETATVGMRKLFEAIQRLK